MIVILKVQYIVYKKLRSFVEIHCIGREKLIAYQREFHALKERLRVAEHRTLQRSSELNTILEQFRRAIAETNGSKDALGHFSAIWSARSMEQGRHTGRSTVRTEHRVHGVHRGATRAKAPGEAHRLKLRRAKAQWRTKQNLDYSFLMMYALNKGTYYVQLEDDIVAKPNYFITMKNFALQLSSEDWMILEFSQLGFIGKMFQAPDLNLIVEFIFMFYKEKPIDWLLDHILWVKACSPEKDAKHCERQKSNLRVRFRPSLFQHVGLHSSLAGKIQKLTGHTLEKTYLGEDFFWAITPTAGDYILFKFDRPVNIER
ncbi:UNVERIFIED_CONTAM: hypothetical protein FKN15_013093 [Acipenser sinensis]